MTNQKSDVLIIGAGLTGLALAYYLRNENLNVSILEARDRLGGRIYTKRLPDQAALEMGATWLGKQHTKLHQLLVELGIKTFKQQMGETAVYEPFSTSPPQLVQIPQSEYPSYRIQGGTDRLISKLAGYLKEEQVKLGQVVRSIKLQEKQLVVKTEDQIFEAPTVISTLPPYLFQQSIEVHPSLPDPLLQIARGTQTWMGDSIKVGLTFADPFWRSVNLSGTIFSNVGPAPEMYDHSNQEDTHYALKGFFNGSYFSATKEDRLKHLLVQLRKYFGKEVDHFLSYEELVWKNEHYTSADYTAPILPHQNNGHPLYKNSYLEDRLYFGGAETNASFPGYMEGAVRSAEEIYQKLKTRLA